MYTFNIQKV